MIKISLVRRRCLRCCVAGRSGCAWGGEGLVRAAGSYPGVAGSDPVFIAGTGGDMSVFPTAGHLASWARISPGSHESAGRVKSTKARPGNRYLKGVLGIAALSAARSTNTYFSAKYKRLATQRGPLRTIVAVEHAMIIVAHSMLTDGRLLPRPRLRLLHRTPIRL